MSVKTFVMVALAFLVVGCTSIIIVQLVLPPILSATVQEKKKIETASGEDVN